MINEKTLEINVLDDILKKVRKTNRKAFAYGVTLNFERRVGIDSSIEISPYASMFAFQFKKLKKKTNDTYWFEFNNNKKRNQHYLIQRAALFSSSMKPWVFYALPTFEDSISLSKSSPNFLKKTYFIDPIDVILLPPHNQKHNFEIDPKTRTYTVHSKVYRKKKLLTWNDLWVKVSKNRIKISELRAKIKEKRIIPEIEFDYTKVKSKSRLYLNSIIIPNKRG